MKILHFVHNFPPEFRGGTESYVLNLSLRQIRTRNEVLVVTGSTVENAGVPRKKELFGPVRVLRLFKLPEDGAVYKIMPHYPRLSREVLDIMRTFKPDLVHMHHWQQLTDDIIRTAAAERIPVVLTLHDFFSVCPRFFRKQPDAKTICPSRQSPAECYTCIRNQYRIPPKELSDELYNRRASMYDEVQAASYTYTFSKTVADFFSSLAWFPKVPIGVRPIGLLRPLRPIAKEKIKTKKLKVVTWGGHNEVKGSHLLLEAAMQPDIKDKIEVHLLGRITPGPYGDRLKETASRCGAVLHGYFPEEEKAELGSRYDLAVFPTQAFETYSIVVDEALAMGMPVIATSPGAQCERVGKAGKVVPAGDVKALARAIQGFLNPMTREKAAAAAAEAQVGTMDLHWLELRDVYHTLVHMNGRRNRTPHFFYPWIERSPVGGAARPLLETPHWPHLRDPRT